MTFYLVVTIVWIAILITDFILNLFVSRMYRKYNSLLCEQNELIKKMIFGARKNDKEGV